MAGLSLLVKLFSSTNQMIKQKTDQFLQSVTLDSIYIYYLIEDTCDVIYHYCGVDYYISLLYNKDYDGLIIPLNYLIEKKCIN